jgi:tRNA-modifying protein YgfZ
MADFAYLPDRGVISVTGPDRVTFLNGLISNDAKRAIPGQAVWAALLTPQGRYLSDFFILAEEHRLFLDLPRDTLETVLTRLRRYKLRANAELDDVSGAFRVYAAWNGMPPPIPITAPDPRLPEAGYRCLTTEDLPTNATGQDYDAHRLALGLPNGPPDLEADKTLLLEAGFDELSGVSWDKGCYMGQELTARTKYRGLIKRRLVPVSLSAPAPVGTPVTNGDTEVGTLRSSAGSLGLATLRLDALDKPLRAGSALVQPRIPAWMRLPE